jgi:hypothetical protein
MISEVTQSALVFFRKVLHENYSSIEEHIIPYVGHSQIFRWIANINRDSTEFTRDPVV